MVRTKATYHEDKAYGVQGGIGTALDGFCDEGGIINPELPRARWNVSFTDVRERTLVTTLVSYKSPEDVQKAIDMGLKDGLASTLERLDELLSVTHVSVR